MPTKRTETPSVPTLRHWLEVYYSWLPQLIEEGGIHPEYGQKVAKGLKYSIRALDDSATEYRKKKREEFKSQVNEADEYFEYFQ